MTTGEGAQTPQTTADLFRDRPGWEGADEDVFARRAGEEEPPHPVRAVLEWLAVIVGALLAALLIKTFLFQAFYIPSSSMEPTLMVGDRVLVNKLAYEFGDVERGDVIVFHKPDTLPTSDIDEFIKRVIGLPGDVIEARDGIVFVNGAPLEEAYLPEGTFTAGLSETVVPADSVFVLGDNRGNSTDSRVFGAITIDSIVGQAFVRVWPLNSIGGL
ncbi:MAG: signal peptidase I [Actinomycetota bacterium]